MSPYIDDVNEVGVSLSVLPHIRPLFAHALSHVTCIFCHEAGMTKTMGTVPEKHLKREREDRTYEAITLIALHSVPVGAY